MLTVPNERDDAATVSIEVQMPQDVDLTDVVPEDVEGWTVTTTTRDGDIVDTITWETTGPGLAGEESVELPVAVGPLPAVESLTFPTVQTYDDGDVVRWIEPAPAGQPEPELPVPTLEIAPGSPDATTAPSEPSATNAPPATEPAETPGTQEAAPSTEAAVATSPADTATVTGASEVSTSSTTVEADDDDDQAVWPWVVGGIIAFVVVVVIGAAAIARRRTSG